MKGEHAEIGGAGGGIAGGVGAQLGGSLKQGSGQIQRTVPSAGDGEHSGVSSVCGNGVGTASAGESGIIGGSGQELAGTGVGTLAERDVFGARIDVEVHHVAEEIIVNRIRRTTGGGNV